MRLRNILAHASRSSASVCVGRGGRRPAMGVVIGL